MALHQHGPTDPPRPGITDQPPTRSQQVQIKKRAQALVDGHGRKILVRQAQIESIKETMVGTIGSQSAQADIKVHEDRITQLNAEIEAAQFWLRFRG